MKLLDTPFSGLFIIESHAFSDARGNFVKTFHPTPFRHAGIEFHMREQFYTVSRKDVVRGLHFQRPPFSHAKLVSCLAGAVLDVVVDLRKRSETYGKVFSAELSARNSRGLFIPAGFAHGFRSLEDDSCVLYSTDCEHAPDHDTGVLWSSVPFDWDVTSPIVSERDQLLPAFDTVESPF